MSVKPSDFKYETGVYIEGMGVLNIHFDILTAGEEIDIDHADGEYEVDFAVFDDMGKQITYDIDRKTYNRCHNKAMDEMLNITTKWKKEWEEYMYD